MELLPEILLWLFIINLGIAFGAGLYEARIILPQWFIKSSEGYRVDAAAMNRTDVGRKFWGFVSTGPLTLLTIANLIVSWQSDIPGQDWWLAASLIILMERIGTFSFFIPTAIRLARAEALSAESAAVLVRLWVRMNYIRNAVTFIGWLCALKALSMGA